VSRKKLLDSSATDEEVEEKLEAQLEQLIKQCNDELSLIPKMAGAVQMSSRLKMCGLVEDSHLGACCTTLSPSSGNCAHKPPFSYMCRPLSYLELQVLHALTILHASTRNVASPFLWGMTLFIADSLF
jgi:hypothetical protein